ncbi:two-component sensor histidine kinase, partial [Nostoc sp. 3335mG]
SVETNVGTATITVRDDGVGIPPDRRAAALQRFGRLDASRHESGAGLGLSLVAAVARLHGGGIELDDNRPGLIVRMRIAR